MVRPKRFSSEMAMMDNICLFLSFCNQRWTSVITVLSNKNPCCLCVNCSGD